MASFKLYKDKSSLDSQYSRYVMGGTTDTILNGTMLGWWEKKEIAIDETTDIFFTITKTYEGRPDNIAYFLYGRDDLAWLVLQYNNIVDINEELVAGKTIRLPSYERAMYNIVNN